MHSGSEVEAQCILFPAYGRSGWARLGVVTERIATGAGRPWEKSHSSVSSEHQDICPGITVSSECGAGHMLNFLLGVVAGEQEKRDFTQAGKPFPGRE